MHIRNGNLLFSVSMCNPDILDLLKENVSPNFDVGPSFYLILKSG